MNTELILQNRFSLQILLLFPGQLDAFACHDCRKHRILPTLFHLPLHLSSTFFRHVDFTNKNFWRLDSKKKYIYQLSNVSECYNFLIAVLWKLFSRSHFLFPLFLFPILRSLILYVVPFFTEKTIFSAKPREFYSFLCPKLFHLSTKLLWISQSNRNPMVLDFIAAYHVDPRLKQHGLKSWLEHWLVWWYWENFFCDSVSLLVQLKSQYNSFHIIMALG